MPMPQYCTKTVLTIPGGTTYTTTQTGSAINLAVSHDVHADAHTGYLRDAQILVEQASGSGNNSGRKFVITVQTSRTPAGPWVPLKMGTTIELTANVEASFSSTIQGPLSGYMRVVATAVSGDQNPPQADFAVYVIAGG